MSHTAPRRLSRVPVPEPWCRLRVERPAGTVVARRTLHGFGPPDLDAVDTVARLLLIARRHGALVAVEDARPELHELLELSGLAGLALGVESGGEAELGEDLPRVEQVEEEAHLGDPPV